jgi:hypothetical protein
LQVVPSEHLLDRVNEASSCLTGLLTKRRQSSISSIGLGRDINLPQPANWLALQEAASVDPQRFAQCSSIASIGFVFAPALWLDQDHFVTTVVSQHLDEPVVEATDFQDGNELHSIAKSIASESGKERGDLLRLRRHLTRLNHISVFITE